jgi:hypothetical protein
MPKFSREGMFKEMSLLVQSQTILLEAIEIGQQDEGTRTILWGDMIARAKADLKRLQTIREAFI